MPERTAPFRVVEDRELVIAFKAGEPGAYDEMYRRYSGRVGNVCRRMLANREDAQEAVQETFLKAYVALPQFNGNYRLGAWLGRIASNVCVDLLRARARSATVVPLQPETSALAVESSPEDVVVGDGPEVAEQMGDIQPLHARALVMRGVEGLSHQEMAGRLAMTPSQVKALLHRARRSFKRSWDDAKGWALAPLVMFRNTARQLRNASQAGSQIAGATATVGPMLAERVAASAMIVAVLTGMPASTTLTSPDRSKVVSRSHATEWQINAPKEARRTESSSTARPAVRAKDAPGVAVEKGGALVAGIGKMLERAHATVTPPDEKPDEKNDDDQLVPFGQTDAGRTIEKVAGDVEDILPTP